MKILIINKSDLQGGAAIVSTRLLMALREAGIDAHMLVSERLSQIPEIRPATSPLRQKVPFVLERLKILKALLPDKRENLFKIDTASDGLPLWKHPWVEEADVVILGWVNQGMLSLQGIRRIARGGKKILWMMHDMWQMTGICHHAGECTNFLGSCGCCPLLPHGGSDGDLSHRVWQQKQRLYADVSIHFIAVSNWLALRARQSELLKSARVSVLHNPFPVEEAPIVDKPAGKTILLFGAARIDDPIKGFPIFLESLRLLKQKYPRIADNLEVHTYGDIRNAALLDEIPLAHRHLGVIRDRDILREAYVRAGIVVSSSLYETLPGTLVEGQAWGCIPVAFDRGGQRDIIDDGDTGMLANFDDGAPGLAQAIVRAYEAQSPEQRRRMHASVTRKFSPSSIVRQLLRELRGRVKS